MKVRRIAPGHEEAPVSELVDQDSLTSTTRGFRAFLPCRAAVVPLDAELHGGNHPPPREDHWVAAAEAQPRAAGPARPGLPAERRDVRRAGGRVRDRQDHSLEVRERDRGTARWPRPEAPRRGPGREEGWAH